MKDLYFFLLWLFIIIFTLSSSKVAYFTSCFYI